MYKYSCVLTSITTDCCSSSSSSSFGDELVVCFSFFFFLVVICRVQNSRQPRRRSLAKFLSNAQRCALSRSKYSSFLSYLDKNNSCIFFYTSISIEMLSEINHLDNVFIFVTKSSISFLYNFIFVVGEVLIFLSYCSCSIVLFSCSLIICL